MACFTVPAGEAVVTTIVKKTMEKNGTEKKNDGRVSMTRKLKWLSNLLWGGSVLLAFEHVWHGEVAPFFPFLTAMSDPEDMREMFFEMATTGVGMAVSVTAVWGVVCAVADHLVKKGSDDVVTESEEA